MTKVKPDTFIQFFSFFLTLSGPSHSLPSKAVSCSPTYFLSVSIMNFDLEYNIQGLTVMKQINGIP